MAIIPDVTSDTGEEKWRRCPAAGCGNDFDKDPDRFVVSGDGTWRNTITCRSCFKVRKKVPDEVIVELLHEQLLHAGLDGKIDNIRTWFSEREDHWKKLTKESSP